MPLDPAGELLTDLGPHFHTVPATKWTDTVYWPAAHQHALSIFARTVKDLRVKKQMPIVEPGYFPPESVVVQEYRTQGMLVFLFQARLAGADYYTDVRIALPEQDERDLILAGRWKRETVQ